MRACNTRGENSQAKPNTLSTSSRKMHTQLRLPRIETDLDLQFTISKLTTILQVAAMQVNKLDNTNTRLAWVFLQLTLSNKSLLSENLQSLSIKNSLFQSSKTIFLNSNLDKEILEHSKSNSDISKINTNKSNSTNRKSRLKVLLELVRIDLKSTDLLESSMDSKTKIILPKKNKSS